MANLWIDQALASAAAHFDAGRIAQAETLARQALQLDRQCAPAMHLLARAAESKGDWPGAEGLLRRAIAATPTSARFHADLGRVLQTLRRHPEAATAFETALRQPSTDPSFTGETMLALAATYMHLGRQADAAQMYHTALTHLPNSAIPHATLGFIYRQSGHLAEALAHARRAVDLDPHSAMAQLGLGNSLSNVGQIDEALTAYRRAAELNPSSHHTHSNLLYAMLFSPTCTQEEILAEHRRWAARHAAPLAGKIPPHTNTPDPERPLRIAYCAPTIGTHIVGRLLDVIMSRHDRSAFEVYIYADNPKPCDVTDRIRAAAAHFRTTGGLSDAQLTAQITADRIDILVDLNLHMALSRLPVFACKPAPVQICHMGYPGTTGMEAVDYALTDPHLDPPDAGESHYAEQLLRLPHCYWCYPASPTGPNVGPLPADANGIVTFGSLNTFRKINAQTARLWARILSQVPGSRLVLLLPGGPTHAAAVTRLFLDAGIPADRLLFLPHAPRDEYLLHYHQIDIALDTLPYNSHTTGLDNLWMGVPLITLAGHNAVSRAGVCLLKNIGLPEWIASTEEEYVDKAVQLAQDRDQLRSLRSTLRQRLENSPLMDAPAYTRALESLYRQAWREWCQRHAAPPT